MGNADQASDVFTPSERRKNKMNGLEKGYAFQERGWIEGWGQ